MSSKIDGIRLRIRKFVLAGIKFARKVPKDEVSRILISQLIRAATSVGANYEEGTETQSSKDLVYKLSVAKKELKETRYWVEIICDCYPQLIHEGKTLIQESIELSKIFFSIMNKKK